VLRAIDEISYLSIDSELLDVMITWTRQVPTRFPTAVAARWCRQRRLDDHAAADERHSNRIPPANIQASVIRLQRTPFRAGEIVIKTG